MTNTEHTHTETMPLMVSRMPFYYWHIVYANARSYDMARSLPGDIFKDFIAGIYIPEHVSHTPHEWHEAFLDERYKPPTRSLAA